MRNLKFHLVRAKNILCFGPEGITIDFSEYDMINQVKGINLDAPGTDADPASNGSGKSSIQELMSIGLFGRTVKNPTKNKGAQIVNALAKKGEVEVQWDDLRVIRSFTVSSSGSVTSKIDVWQSKDRIWDKDTKITQVSGDTKKFLEEKIGISHHTFCNVVIFDDSNTYSFLEADTPTKRQIVENLLDLEQYRDYCENAKIFIKELKKKVMNLGNEYSHLVDAVEACDKRISTLAQQETMWRATKKNELEALRQRLETKQNMLGSTDAGEKLSIWQKAQEKITQLTDEVYDLESKKTRLSEAIDAARGKLGFARDEKQAINEVIQACSLAVEKAKAEYNNTSDLINKLENLKEGATCPTCLGTINRNNYGHVLELGKEKSAQCKEIIDNKVASINLQKDLFGKKSATVSMMEGKIKEAESKSITIDSSIRNMRSQISQLASIPKPEGTVSEHVLEAEIVELKKQVKNKSDELEGQSPYKEIVDQANAEKTVKESERDLKSRELSETEAEIPYYEFWLEAFGDNGIRKFVIDGIIPSLNERVAYWLQVLIDGLIEVTFNNKLEETITRNGTPAAYSNMSKGELNRINLAVSQSFAYVMMLNSGCCPSIISLDEITGGSIDRAGIPYVYNMICELAKDRQVFVTTHNETLMGMLQGCRTLTLKKENDITVLVS